MTKRKAIDVFKYWPIALFLFSLAGSWFTLNAKASQQEKALAKVETKVEKQEETYSTILVNQARQQAVMEQVLEYVKEIKDK